MTEHRTGDLPLRGKVALVTGAGRALGQTLALAFSAAGASLAANDLTPAALDQTVMRARAAGGNARAYVEDASKGLPAAALVEQVWEDFGRIDVLVNNPTAGPSAPVLEMDEWDWQRTLDMNLNGPFLLMRAAGRIMRDLGGGVILNVCGACPGSPAEAGKAAYRAAGAGLAALAKTAALEFLAYNICVHTICLREMAQSPGGASSPLESTPTTLEEIAQLALLLCHPASARLTGQVFRFDVAPAAGKR